MLRRAEILVAEATLKVIQNMTAQLEGARRGWVNLKTAFARMKSAIHVSVHR